VVHLLNPLWDAYGGSEWRTLSLFELLAEHTEVAVWTEYTPDASLLGRYPIREMLKTGTYPKEGTFVFVGAYWDVGAWLKLARPARVILVYNVLDPDTLDYRIDQLHQYGVKEVELVFSSAMMAEHAGGRRGTVELSPIDLDRFAPNPGKDAVSSGAVTIGRHSRDQAFKHHPNDPNIYGTLIKQGCRVRLLGATCLADRIDDKRIELLPAGAEPADEFLRSLDIFFYQTDPSWTEPYGRIVAEAMASGLPCVLERGGGYEELVAHGENGFLFDSQEEALALISTLLEDESLRRTIGAAARDTIDRVYSAERERIVQFYVSSEPILKH
jgi:glycosyltransferase involved in cell wall biosynthesis